MSASELEEIERLGTQRLSYEQITSLVRATQPPRPSWWDEGHEHDLSLVDAHLAPRSGLRPITGRGSGTFATSSPSGAPDKPTETNRQYDRR